MGVQQTESSLFSTLFDEFREPFILFANSYVRDRAAAEDIYMKAIIRRTLNELPQQTRTIFFKSRYENRTNREIAAELGISIKTVEFHISKALKLFRHRLKDYLPVLMMLMLTNRI